jgi:hypothetical protein
VKFKLDENLSRRATNLIRAAGPDAVTVASQGLRGAPDETLFEVCRRDVPIITFVNKLDREGRDPFDPLDEVPAVAGTRRDAGLLAAQGPAGRCPHAH